MVDEYIESLPDEDQAWGRTLCREEGEEAVILDQMYPQKAKSTEDPEWFENNEHGLWVMEPKLDGYRAHIVHDERGVSIYSTALKPFTGRAPHIEAAVTWLPEGTILDGEFAYPKEMDGDGLFVVCDFKKTKEVMGSKPEAAVDKQNATHGLIYFVVFDCLYFDGMSLLDQPLLVRRRVAAEAVHRIDSPHILLGRQEKPDAAKVQAYIDAGAEGVVFKKLDTPYTIGTKGCAKPNNTWYKFKMKDTEDCVVMDFLPAKPWYMNVKPDSNCSECLGGEALLFRYPFGHNKNLRPNQPQRIKGEDTTCPNCGARLTQFWLDGLVGSIVFGQYCNGELVQVGDCSGFNMELRQAFTDNPQLFVGQVIEVKHNGLTPDSFRHPQFLRFRDDKQPIECEWRER